jgi:recombination protein RecT
MTTEIVKVKKELSEDILAKIASMEQKKQIFFPKNYSPENAINSAFLAIQQAVDKNGKTALEICTRESVANALLDTAIQGLSPAKKQVYFIVRGNKLCADRSYFGTVAVLKRLPSVVDVFAQAIYKGDVFEFRIEGARKIITKHEQTFDTIANGEVVGAYASILYKEGDEKKEYSDVMTMKDIQASWNKSKSQQRTVHNEFPDQMAKRTVLNRTCKTFINSSDDSDLDIVVQSFNQTDGREEVPEHKENANTEEIVIDKSNVVDNVPETDQKYEPVKEEMKF